MKELKIGDYVLATKYHDGGSRDHWCVGFLSEVDKSRKVEDRYIVIDNDGRRFRFNGFRRCERITGKRGKFILDHTDIIESGNRSLWGWKRASMKAI